MNEQAVIEKTVDALETTFDAVEDVQVVVKNNPWLIAGVGVAGMVVGAAMGYWATKKYAMAMMEETLEEQIQEAQQYFDRVYREGDFATPESAAQALIPDEDRKTLETAETLKEAYSDAQDEREPAMVVDYTQPHKLKKSKKTKIKTEEYSEEIEGDAIDEVREKTRSSIWVNEKPLDEGGWDYDSIERSEDHPYVISEEEFFESAAATGDFEAEQQLTWYSLDDTLADEAGDVFPTDRVGADNLKMFGRFPGVDPNVIYVKNEMLKRVYEITFSEGGYKHEVQGFDYSEEETRRLHRRIRGDED